MLGIGMKSAEKNNYDWKKSKLTTATWFEHATFGFLLPQRIRSPTRFHCAMRSMHDRRLLCNKRCTILVCAEANWPRTQSSRGARVFVFNVHPQRCTERCYTENGALRARCFRTKTDVSFVFTHFHISFANFRYKIEIASQSLTIFQFYSREIYLLIANKSNTALIQNIAKTNATFLLIHLWACYLKWNISNWIT